MPSQPCHGLASHKYTTTRVNQLQQNIWLCRQASKEQPVVPKQPGGVGQTLLGKQLPELTVEMTSVIMNDNQLHMKWPTNIVSSISCLLQLLPPAETLDGSIQHEVLFHGDFRPQDVKLWAHSQVLSNGSHVVLDAHAIDHCVACKAQGAGGFAQDP